MLYMLKVMITGCHTLVKRHSDDQRSQSEVAKYINILFFLRNIIHNLLFQEHGQKNKCKNENVKMKVHDTVHHFSKVQCTGIMGMLNAC